VAFNLLKSDLSPSARLFAAQTIRQKVQFVLSQLLPQQTIALKNDLLTLLSDNVISTSNPIKTQLALILADLAIQSDNWHNPTIELLHVLSQNNLLFLLDFLTCLPEEIMSNYHIPIDVHGP
jgi:transportin-3